MEDTCYGLKQLKKSHFIIVAPHAGGDDIRTKELTISIAELLNCSCIINTKYYKPTNRKASINSSNIENFNKLSWSSRKKIYNWSNKKKSMITFFRDIDYIIDANKNFKNLIIIYIHGHAKSENIGIDIGVGGKYYKNKILSTNEHSEAGKNTGSLTANQDDILYFQSILEKELQKNYNLQVTIGYLFAAWSRQDAVQYHSNSKNYAIQLEFSVLLRKLENIKNTAKIVSECLTKTYSRNNA